jgi:putative ABC transport system permease protein
MLERNAHRPSVIVNTSFVEQVLGGGQAVGRRIRYLVGRDQEPGEWYEIVGVVGGLAMNATNPTEDAGVYHPLGPNEYHPMRYIVEVGSDPASFVPRLTSIASGVDADAMIQVPQVLADLADLGRVELRLASLLVVTLSLIGTLLAAAGLYALMSFTVSQRTREIGIRPRWVRAASVVSTIVRRAAYQLGAGVVLGCAFGTWLLMEVTNGADIMDMNIPAVLAGVGVAVILMVTLACLAPIRRGLRIQPTEALRE